MPFFLSMKITICALHTAHSTWKYTALRESTSSDVSLAYTQFSPTVRFSHMPMPLANKSIISVTKTRQRQRDSRSFCRWVSRFSDKFANTHNFVEIIYLILLLHSIVLCFENMIVTRPNSEKLSFLIRKKNSRGKNWIVKNRNTSVLSWILRCHTRHTQKSVR